MMTLPTEDQIMPTDPTHTPPRLANRRVHFIGIGGCGMSGLARLAKHLGADCSGSDLNASATVKSLQEQGIDVVLEQSAKSLPEDVDLVVISAAIKNDHPELAEALRRGVEVMKYAQLLGTLMIGRTGVAIAGTHGKSTTTSMLAHILIQTGLDPCFIVGANCQQIGGGVRVGESDILLAEACEYDRSFHNFFPTHAAILNVEADHLDIYAGIDEIVEAFKVFAERIPPPERGNTRGHFRGHFRGPNAGSGRSEGPGIFRSVFRFRWHPAHQPRNAPPPGHHRRAELPRRNHRLRAPGRLAHRHQRRPGTPAPRRTRY